MCHGLGHWDEAASCELRIQCDKHDNSKRIPSILDFCLVIMVPQGTV